MFSIFKKSLLALSFVFIGSLSSVFANITSENVKSRIKDIYEIAKPLTDQKVESQNIWDFVRSPYKFVKEETLEDGLIDVCDDLLLQKLPVEQETKIKNIKSELIEYLKGFIAKGTDWQSDCNFALFFDEMNPNFKLNFMNSEGKIKTRKYAVKIWSVGLKVEIAIRSHAMMILSDENKPLNYYDSNQEFIFDNGVDFSISPVAGACVVVANIKGTSHQVLILGMLVGASVGISYVFGGRMTPIKA